jgi:hypothetical protein
MLDSSRRLRMDERRPFVPNEPCEQIGSDAVPIAADIQYPPRESSLVVYCDSEQLVSEGFAIALRMMGVEANVLHADIAPATNSPQRRMTKCVRCFG